MALDITLARTNLEMAITTKQRELALLEEGLDELKKFEEDKLSTVLSLLSTYGKRAKAPTNGNGNGQAVHKDAPLVRNVLNLVTSLGRSMPIAEVHAELVKQDIVADLSVVGQCLSALTGKGKLRRFAPGIYGPLAQGPVTPQNSATSHEPLTGKEYFARLAETIYKAVKSADGPINAPEVLQRVEAAGFPFPKQIRNRQGALARLLRKDKRLKKHGFGRHRKYSA